MIRPTLLIVVPLLMVATFAVGAARGPLPKAGPKLAHMVFFALKDHSAGSRDALVAACQKYLTKHEGVVSFSVGTIAEDVVEPNVSVRNFDVALHVVFENKAARDTYLVHPRHVAFVDENKASFAGVRVFDSYLAAE